jgi:hypothetical protein
MHGIEGMKQMLVNAKLAATAAYARKKEIKRVVDPMEFFYLQ